MEGYLLLESFSTAYEQAFLIFSRRVERFVLWTLSSLVIMVVVAQIMLQFAPLRAVLSHVDALEGQPFFSIEEQHK
jgi:hypothetical protein